MPDRRGFSLRVKATGALTKELDNRTAAEEYILVDDLI